MDLYQILDDAWVFIGPSSDPSKVYNLEIGASSLNISQTFTEKTFPQKTIGSPLNLIEAGTTNKANPANFSFKVPILKDSLQTPVILDLLTGLSNNNLKTFTLWIFLAQKAYTLTNCCFTSGTIGIQRTEPLSISLEGEASRLYVYAEDGTDGNSAPAHRGEVIATSRAWTDNYTTFDVGDYRGNNEVRPGFASHGGTLEDPYDRSTGITYDPNSMPVFQQGYIQGETYPSKYIELTEAQMSSGTYGTAGGENKDSLASLSIEIQNNIKWLGYQTVKGAVAVDTASVGHTETQYPTSFVLTGQSLAGNASFFIKNDITDTFMPGYDTTTGFDQKWKNNYSLVISAFGRESGTNYGVQMSGVTNLTSTLSMGEQPQISVDWRLATGSIANALTFTL